MGLVLGAGYPLVALSGAMVFSVLVSTAYSLFSVPLHVFSKWLVACFAKLQIISSQHGKLKFIIGKYLRTESFG